MGLAQRYRDAIKRQQEEEEEEERKKKGAASLVPKADPWKAPVLPPAVQGPPVQLPRPSLAQPQQPRYAPSNLSSPPLDTSTPMLGGSSNDSDTRSSRVQTPLAPVFNPQAPQVNIQPRQLSDRLRDPYNAPEQPFQRSGVALPDMLEGLPRPQPEPEPEPDPWRPLSSYGQGQPARTDSTGFVTPQNQFSLTPQQQQQRQELYAPNQNNLFNQVGNYLGQRGQELTSAIDEARDWWESSPGGMYTAERDATRRNYEAPTLNQGIAQGIQNAGKTPIGIAGGAIWGMGESMLGNIPSVREGMIGAQNALDVFSESALGAMADAPIPNLGFSISEIATPAADYIGGGGNRSTNILDNLMGLLPYVQKEMAKSQGVRKRAGELAAAGHPEATLALRALGTSGADAALYAMDALVNRNEKASALEQQAVAIQGQDPMRAGQLFYEAQQLRQMTNSEIVEQYLDPAGEFAYGMIFDWANVVGPLGVLIGPEAQAARRAGKLVNVTPAQAIDNLRKAQRSGTQLTQALTQGSKVAQETFNEIISPFLSPGERLANVPLVGWLGKRTPESRAALDTEQLWQGLGAILSGITNKNDIRVVLNALTTAPDQLVRGLGNLSQETMQRLGQPDGLAHWGAGLVGNNDFTRRLPILSTVKEELSNLRALQGEGGVNSHDLLSELHGYVIEASRRVNGAKEPNRLPFGAANVKLERIGPDSAVISYVDAKGKMIQRSVEMGVAEAQRRISAIQGALKPKGKGLMDYARLPSDIQRAIMSDLWLGMRPANWLGNALGATTSLFANDAYTLLPNSQMQDYLSAKMGGIMPSTRTEEIATGTKFGLSAGTEVTSGAVDKLASLITRNPNNAASRGMRWLYDRPYGSTEIPLPGGLKIPFGEGAFYTRAYYVPFMRTFNAGVVENINQNLIPRLQQMEGMTPQLIQQVGDWVVTLAQSGGKSDVATGIRKLVGKPELKKTLKGLGVPPELLSPQAARQIEQFIMDAAPSEAEPVMREISRILAGERNPAASVLNIAPGGPGITDWTDVDLSQEAAYLADDLARTAKKAGIDPELAQQQATELATRIVEQQNAMYSRVLGDLADASNNPDTWSVVTDFWQDVYATKLQARQVVDELGRQASQLQTPEAWRAKWEGTRQAYGESLNQLTQLGEQARIALQDTLGGKAYAPKYNWWDTIENYLGWDEEALRATRNVELGRADAADAKLWQQVIDANREYLDNAVYELFGAFQRYPSLENFDILRNGLRKIEIMGAQVRSFLDEQLANGVAGDAYNKLRNESWNNYFDAGVAHNEFLGKTIVRNGLLGDTATRLQWTEPGGATWQLQEPSTTPGKWWARDMESGKRQEFTVGEPSETNPFTVPKEVVDDYNRLAGNKQAVDDAADEVIEEIRRQSEQSLDWRNTRGQGPSPMPIEEPDPTDPQVDIEVDEAVAAVRGQWRDELRARRDEAAAAYAAGPTPEPEIIEEVVDIDFMPDVPTPAPTAAVPSNAEIARAAAKAGVATKDGVLVNKHLFNVISKDIGRKIGNLDDLTDAERLAAIDALAARATEPVAVERLTKAQLLEEYGDRLRTEQALTDERLSKMSKREVVKRVEALDAAPKSYRPEDTPELPKKEYQPSTVGTGATEGQRRAKPGGEVGMNGMFYPGGTFMPSTALEKMPPRPKGKGTKAVQYDRYNWDVPPTETARPIYPLIGANLKMERPTDMATSRVSVAREYKGMPGYGDPHVNALNGYSSDELAEIWNQGGRWVEPKPKPDVAPTPSTVGTGNAPAFGATTAPRKAATENMFADSSEDLPLVSGMAQRVEDKGPFKPVVDGGQTEMFDTRPTMGSKTPTYKPRTPKEDKPFSVADRAKDDINGLEQMRKDMLNAWNKEVVAAVAPTKGGKKGVRDSFGKLDDYVRRYGGDRINMNLDKGEVKMFEDLYGRTVYGMPINNLGDVERFFQQYADTVQRIRQLKGEASRSKQFAKMSAAEIVKDTRDELLAAGLTDEDIAELATLPRRTVLDTIESIRGETPSEPGMVAYDYEVPSVAQLLGLETPEEVVFDTIYDWINRSRKTGNNSAPQMAEVAAVQIRSLNDLERTLRQRLPEILRGEPNQLNGAQRLQVVDAVLDWLPEYDNTLTKAQRVADRMANHMMLNYNDRRNFDTILAMTMFPYHYFWSRMPSRILMGALTKPGIVNFYYESKRAIALENEQSDVPDRLQGTLPIPGTNARINVSRLIDYAIPAMNYLQPNPFVEIDETDNEAEKWVKNVGKWTPGLFTATEALLDATDLKMDNYYGDVLSELMPISLATIEQRRTGQMQAQNGWMAKFGLGPDTADDGFGLDAYRARRAVSYIGVEEEMPEGVVSAAQQVIVNQSQGAPVEKDIDPQFLQQALDLAERGVKRAAEDRLVSRGTSYLSTMAVSPYPQAEIDMRQAQNAYHASGYNEQTNPYGSKELQKGIIDATPELGNWWSKSNETPGLDGQISKLYDEGYATGEWDRVMPQIDALKRQAAETTGEPVTTKPSTKGMNPTEVAAAEQKASAQEHWDAYHAIPKGDPGRAQYLRDNPDFVEIYDANEVKKGRKVNHWWEEEGTSTGAATTAAAPGVQAATDQEVWKANADTYFAFNDTKDWDGQTAWLLNDNEVFARTEAERKFNKDGEYPWWYNDVFDENGNYLGSGDSKGGAAGLKRPPSQPMSVADVLRRPYDAPGKGDNPILGKGGSKAFGSPGGGGNGWGDEWGVYRSLESNAAKAEYLRNNPAFAEEYLRYVRERDPEASAWWLDYGSGGGGAGDSAQWGEYWDVYGALGEDWTAKKQFMLDNPEFAKYYKDKYGNAWWEEAYAGTAGTGRTFTPYSRAGNSPWLGGGGGGSRKSNGPDLPSYPANIYAREISRELTDTRPMDRWYPAQQVQGSMDWQRAGDRVQPDPIRKWQPPRF